MKRSAAFPALPYYGKEMRPYVHADTLESVVDRLRRGQMVPIHLEPGDGTRYSLFVSWPGALPDHIVPMTFHRTPEDARDALMVTRVLGDDFRTIEWHPDHENDIYALANSNTWTVTVLAWFLRGLLALVQDGRVEEG